MHFAVILCFDMFELVAKSCFANVLHLHIERGLHVITVLSWLIHNTQIVIEHLLSMITPWNSAQSLVEIKFQTTAGRIFPLIEVAHCANCKIPIRILTRLKFFYMETTVIIRFTEHGQLLHTAIFNVRNTTLQHRPIHALFFSPLCQMFFHFSRLYIGEYFV